MGGKMDSAVNMDNVPSLFVIVETYVVHNFENVESLHGIPELIGESLFKSLVCHCLCTNKDMGPYLAVFCNAYGGVVLNSLNLRSQLVTINEHLESIQPTLTNITALDISHCHLGSSHDLIDCLNQMTQLILLNMSDCGIDDEVIRKITIPCRLYHRGITKVKELDLSDNPKLTIKCVSFLNCLKELNHLHISSGASLKRQDIVTYMSRNGFKEEDPQSAPVSVISNHGWALPVIHKWLTPRPFVLPPRKTFYTSFHLGRIKRQKAMISNPLPKSTTLICLVRQQSPT